jgi:hypothetical protein
MPALKPGHVMQLSITGLGAGQFSLEATESLSLPKWQVIATLTGAGDVPQFTEEMIPGRQERFYRISKH